MATRYVVATATLFALVRMRTGSIRWPGRIGWSLVALGVVGFGGYQVVWSLGLTQITAGESALLIAASPVLTALLAGAVGMDRLTGPKVAGAAVAFVGVALVVVAGHELRLGASLLGDGLTLAAAVCWAIYTVAGARMVRHIDPLQATAWSILGGTLLLLPFGALGAPRDPVRAVHPGGDRRRRVLGGARRGHRQRAGAERHPVPRTDPGVVDAVPGAGGRGGAGRRVPRRAGGHRPGGRRRGDRAGRGVDAPPIGRACKRAGPAGGRRVTSPPPIAILVDYDGTIAQTDVTDTILAEFMNEAWEDRVADYDAGRVGSRALMTWEVGCITAPPERLLAAAATQPHDPTFAPFARAALAAGIRVEVVSDGLGFFIEPALRSLGMGELPVITAATTFGPDGGRIAYPHGNPDCFVCGTCKRNRVLAHQADGRLVVFIGDGESDLYAAGYADVVFAKRSLVRICLERGWPFRRWTEFAEIHAWLDEVLAAYAADPGSLPAQRRAPVFCGAEAWGPGRWNPGPAGRR